MFLRDRPDGQSLGRVRGVPVVEHPVELGVGLCHDDAAEGHSLTQFQNSRLSGVAENSHVLDACNSEENIYIYVCVYICVCIYMCVYIYIYI